jgi:hypothetical protein
MPVDCDVQLDQPFVGVLLYPETCIAWLQHIFGSGTNNRRLLCL